VTLFIDWVTWFRKVCLGLKPLGHYAPWIYLALRPLSALPPQMGGAALGLVGLLVYVRYLGWRALVVVTSAPVLISLVNGNIDSLLVLAFMLPLWAGLVVVSCKPIILFGWALRRVLREGAIDLLPLVGLFAASLLIWGMWPLQMRTGIDTLVSKYDISAFPLLVPLGLVLLGGRSEMLWILGGCLLSPYLAWYQLAPAVAYHAKTRPLWKVVLVWVVMWVYTAWRWM